MFGQNVRGHFEDHLDQLEQRIILEARSLHAEFALRGVARVGLAENGVAVTRDNLTAVKCVPQSFFETFFGRHFAAELGHEILGPAQHFFVGKSVQRASQAVDAGAVGIVSIGQGRSDQMRGVSGNIAGLVV